MTSETPAGTITPTEPAKPTQPVPTALAEHSTVTIRHAVTSYEGVSIPAGTQGVIVSVYGAGAAYAVEFFAPYDTIADVVADGIA